MEDLLEQASSDGHAVLSRMNRSDVEDVMAVCALSCGAVKCMEHCRTG